MIPTLSLVYCYNRSRLILGKLGLSYPWLSNGPSGNIGTYNEYSLLAASDNVLK